MRFSKKIIENVRNHTNIKLMTTKARRNCLESEPMTKKSYKKKKNSDNVLALKMKRTQTQ